MTKYLVRQFPLHKVVVDSKGNRSKQVHIEGSEVDLTAEEYEQYKHLVEPVKKTSSGK